MEPIEKTVFPPEAEACNSRGRARYLKGDEEGALQDYSEAIRLKPGNLPPEVARYHVCQKASLSPEDEVPLPEH